MTKTAQRWVPAAAPAQKGGSNKVQAEGSGTQRGSSKGFQQGVQHLRVTIVPSHFDWLAQLESVGKNPPFLAPFLHLYPHLTTLCG